MKLTILTRTLTSMTSAARRLLVAVAMLSAGTSSAFANAIVVSHDVNTLATNHAGAQEQLFAVNLASFLTASSAGKNILVFESSPAHGGRDFADGVLNALTASGFSVTVTPDFNTSYAGFDAIFVAQSYPTVTFLDNNTLIDYVNGGGSVYLAGGVGPSAGDEAAGWNTFLNHYGLSFASAYTGTTGASITSSHPIFTGITNLGANGGLPIVNLGTNPGAQIVQFAGQDGLYAVVAVPEPATAFLLGAGLLVLVGVARRRTLQ